MTITNRRQKWEGIADPRFPNFNELGVRVLQDTGYLLINHQDGHLGFHPLEGNRRSLPGMSNGPLSRNKKVCDQFLLRGKKAPYREL